MADRATAGSLPTRAQVAIVSPAKSRYPDGPVLATLIPVHPKLRSQRLLHAPGTVLALRCDTSATLPSARQPAGRPAPLLLPRYVERNVDRGCLAYSGRSRRGRRCAPDRRHQREPGPAAPPIPRLPGPGTVAPRFRQTRPITLRRLVASARAIPMRPLVFSQL
jgi:hypothetical protein